MKLCKNTRVGSAEIWRCHLSREGCLAWGRGSGVVPALPPHLCFATQGSLYIQSLSMIHFTLKYKQATMVFSLHRGILYRKILALSNPLNFTFFSCLKSRYLINAY